MSTTKLSAADAIELIASPYPLVARDTRSDGTVVRVGDVDIGGAEFVVIAGPCAVETRPQMLDSAAAVAAAGARILRGGAFKPRTSPYAFQGLGLEGLLLLAEAGATSGLPTVTEVIAAEDVPVVARHADALQVGARNTQNFALLKALGQAGKPVLLKRGMSTNVDELLMAAEYVVAHGNPNVILCERGIRTFETSTRNTLDLNAVAVLKQLTHLPVIVDPSHGTGRRDLVTPLAKASAAVGADGLIIEVHCDPDSAWSDGAQSLTPPAFGELMHELSGHVAVEGRTLASPLWLSSTGCSTERRSSPGRAITAYRDRIDDLDDEILQLLDRRAALARRLGQVKSATGGPITVPHRETTVVARATANATGALPPAAASRIFRTIVEEIRNLQIAEDASTPVALEASSARLVAVD